MGGSPKFRSADTGVAYKNDPTILAWETGNELGAYRLGEGAPPASWTSTIALYIKSIDKNHLVIDGSDGLYNSAGSPIPGLGVSGVDIVSDHFYRERSSDSSRVAVCNR